MELHPLCTLFPRMDGKEFSALVEDIKTNGQREPIILHDGMILDGGNRYRACIEAGIEPQTMRFGGGNIVAYVLSANLHRRHLSAGQHAAIVSSCADWAKSHSHGGDRKSDQAVRLPLETVADRMAQSGASSKTQRNADKVAKADPELAKQVGQGEVSLPRAVEQITGKRTGIKAAVEPAAQEYTQVDAMRDQIDELQSALSAAHMKESTDEEKSLHVELVASLQKELKMANAIIAAVTRSRDQYMAENTQLKRQIAMMQRQQKKAA